jgi:hypothetical protein
MLPAPPPEASPFDVETLPVLPKNRLPPLRLSTGADRALEMVPRSALALLGTLERPVIRITALPLGTEREEDELEIPDEPRPMRRSGVRTPEP